MKSLHPGRRQYGFPQNQAGWTFRSKLFLSPVVAFFAMMGMRLAPLYLANGNVKKVIEISVSDVDLRTVMSPARFSLQTKYRCEMPISISA